MITNPFRTVTRCASHIALYVVLGVSAFAAYEWFTPVTSYVSYHGNIPAKAHFINEEIRLWTFAEMDDWRDVSWYNVIACDENGVSTTYLSTVRIRSIANIQWQRGLPQTANYDGVDTNSDNAAVQHLREYATDNNWATWSMGVNRPPVEGVCRVDADITMYSPVFGFAKTFHVSSSEFLYTFD